MLEYWLIRVQVIRNARRIRAEPRKLSHVVGCGPAHWKVNRARLFTVSSFTGVRRWNVCSRLRAARIAHHARPLPLHKYVSHTARACRIQCRTKPLTYVRFMITCMESLTFHYCSNEKRKKRKRKKRKNTNLEFMETYRFQN